MADGKKQKSKAPGDFAVNRRAWHDYVVLDKIEASLSGAYGAVLGGQLYVVGMNIPVYAFGNRFNHAPQGNRRLLVHKKQIEDLRLKTEAKGLTLIPLRLYLSKGRIKLELGICRGRQLHDKRDALKKKALKRDVERGDV